MIDIEVIIREIWEDILDRRGGDGFLGDLDAGVVAEIESAWRQILKKRIEQKVVSAIPENRQLKTQPSAYSLDIYPIQDASNIPIWLAKIVYAQYVKRYGDQQSFERIRERAGFGMIETVVLLSTLGSLTGKEIRSFVEEVLSS